MPETNPPSPDRRLGDPHYRAALLEKIESLIAVLELARVKVHRNLRIPGSDKLRLNRILDNLKNTLAVCRRAQVALMQASAKPGQGGVFTADGRPVEMNRREFLELQSLAEFYRLRNLGPITDDEMLGVDVEDLCDQLSRESGG